MHDNTWLTDQTILSKATQYQTKQISKTESQKCPSGCLHKYEKVKKYSKSSAKMPCYAMYKGKVTVYVNSSLFFCTSM